MRDHARKHRLILIGTLSVFAPPIAISIISTRHAPLEASLDLLWLLLAVAAVIHWAFGSGRVRLPQLLSLVFVLALLFPMISADDDLARQEVANDAKTSHSLVAGLQSDKRHSASASLPDAAASAKPQMLPALALAFEAVSQAAVAVPNAAPVHATGNHSPPLG